MSRSTAVPLLLLEVSQLLLAGARLGVHEDFVPAEQFEPDAGPDPDLDEMRRRLANLLEGVDDFTRGVRPLHRPTRAGLTPASPTTSPTSRQAWLTACSTTGPATSHEALWWWQFSYVSSWGPEASAVLRAMQSVIAHDRLDADEVGEVEASQLAAAEGI